MQGLWWMHAAPVIMGGGARSQCKDCGGGSINSVVITHGRCLNARIVVEACSICDHGRDRAKCKDSGGSGICDHGRWMSQCKDELWWR